MADEMSCSSQDSITPTARDKPDQIDGNTTTFVISGSAHQINPIQANQNSGKGFTINNRCEAPGGSRTRDFPIVGSSSKNSSTSKDQKKRKQTHVGSSSKNSSTSKGQKKWKQTHGGTTTFEISCSTNQINPIEANENSRENFTRNNCKKAPVGIPTSDIPIGTVGSSSKNSSTSKDKKNWKQTHGGTTTFEIRGSANQINPTQANQNRGENFRINNSQEAPVGNPTGDILIGAGKKDGSSSKNSSTSKDQKNWKQTHGGITNFEISGRANQINPTQANQNTGENFTINNSQEAPVGNPTSDIPTGNGEKVGSSSKNSSTSKDQKNWKQTHGGITTFKISGQANQINPTQANQNTGENFTVNNSQEAPVGNPTSDIPIRTGEKGK